MVGHSSLFSQLLSVVNRHKFERRVTECRAEKAAKGFSCWGQFVAMMFCQLAQAKSLREISDGLACCEGKLNHLGLEACRKERSTENVAEGFARSQRKHVARFRAFFSGGLHRL